MLTSTSPITVLEWKRMEHSLQQALLSLDTIQKQGILEHYTQKFPSESHEQVLLAFTKYERKKFLHHFDQLKLKRKILVDRYLKALTTIDTQLSLLES
ncbi:hypothetical protein HMI56_005894 [Coelomomyces lativittatus]|nr:hypothetical protein HMI56_005894 [Coelomomyces lativittatus]